MKKIILLAGALCCATAAAEVKIYGELKSGIETSYNKTGVKRNSHTQVSDFGSRIGIRGSHPIGGGNSNKILLQWEQDAPVSSAGPLRETWQEHREGGRPYTGVGNGK